MSSNAPFQVRTTYFDGSTTTDMVNNKTGSAHDALNEFIARYPEFTSEVTRLEILDLNNQVLDSHDFAAVERRAA
jgi:hypothetical protein